MQTVQQHHNVLPITRTEFFFFFSAPVAVGEKTELSGDLKKKKNSFHHSHLNLLYLTHQLYLKAI